MYEAKQPVKAHVEVLGPYQLLLCIESANPDTAGNPRFHFEVSCIDANQVEHERQRICDKLGLACIAWSMPQEALTVNLLPLGEAIKTARITRKHSKEVNKHGQAA